MTSEQGEGRTIYPITAPMGSFIWWSQGSKHSKEKVPIYKCFLNFCLCGTCLSFIGQRSSQGQSQGRVALAKDVERERGIICDHFCGLPHVMMEIDENWLTLACGELYPGRGRVQIRLSRKRTSRIMKFILWAMTYGSVNMNKSCNFLIKTENQSPPFPLSHRPYEIRCENTLEEIFSIGLLK